MHCGRIVHCGWCVGGRIVHSGWCVGGRIVHCGWCVGGRNALYSVFSSAARITH
ncbi:TPA: hypothetical protein SLO96_002969 [Proteus mirabilis]|nr:hypothetical protein [Proteus mirabilis]